MAPIDKSVAQHELALRAAKGSQGAAKFGVSVLHALAGLIGEEMVYPISAIAHQCRQSFF